MRPVLVLVLIALAFPASAAAELSSTPDPSWPVTDGPVLALAREGSTVYVGGAFRHIGPRGQAGVERHGLAAVDEDGHVLPWNPGTDGPVSALLVKDGLVYAGGHFTQAGGAARTALAAIGPDGRATDFDAHLAGDGGGDPGVGALALSPRGIYAGGSFVTPLGQHALAVLGADGAATGFDARLTATQTPVGNPTVGPPYVGALLAASDHLYVGGYFATAGGQSHDAVAVLDGNAVPTAFAPALSPGCNTFGPTEPTVGSFARGPGRLWIGGSFDGTVGGVGTSIRAYDPDSGARQASDPAPRPPYPHPPDCARIQALALDGDTLYVGGAFGYIGGAAREGFAALGPDGQALPFAPRDLAPDVLLAGRDELIAGTPADPANGSDPELTLARFIPVPARVPDRTAPVLRKLSVRPGFFRAVGTRRRRGVPVGAKLRFALSERASVTVTVSRAGRPQPAGSFALRGVSAGTATRRFHGRLSGRPLPPGRYVLRARATDVAGNRSRVSRASFTIAR